MKIADMKISAELIDATLLDGEELKIAAEIFRVSQPLLMKVSLEGSLGDLTVTSIAVALRAVKANLEPQQLVIPGLEGK